MYFGWFLRIFAPIFISKSKPPQVSRMAEQVQTLKIIKQTSAGKAPGVTPKNKQRIPKPKQLMMPIPIPPYRVPNKIAPITMMN